MEDKKDILRGVRLFVLDLDGTVYLSDTPIEGAREFTERVAASEGRDLLFFSNNASRTSSFYVEKLTRMGFYVAPHQVMTAGDVTAQYLLRHHAKERVFLNGTKALKSDWLAKGIMLSEDEAEIAVQSFDLEMTYERMERICHLIRKGALFYATHKDINCPVEGGFIPDCGAMCALISASCGVSPRYFGKPEEETIAMICERYGMRREEVAFVGDRIYTDVAAGVMHGAKGFLVLTGEADEETVRSSDIRPTAVFSSLKEMKDYL